MTARERAEAIGQHEQIIGIGTIRRSWLKDAIEQAINAAVEEEREACAQICEDKIDRINSATGYADPGLAYSAVMAADIRDRIRARCNKSATEKNNT
jgi:hypothetical protein